MRELRLVRRPLRGMASSSRFASSALSSSTCRSYSPASMRVVDAKSRPPLSASWRRAPETAPSSAPTPTAARRTSVDPESHPPGSRPAHRRGFPARSPAARHAGRTCARTVAPPTAGLYPRSPRAGPGSRVGPATRRRSRPRRSRRTTRSCGAPRGRPSGAPGALAAAAWRVLLGRSLPRSLAPRHVSRHHTVRVTPDRPRDRAALAGRDRMGRPRMTAQCTRTLSSTTRSPRARAMAAEAMTRGGLAPWMTAA